MTPFDRVPGGSYMVVPTYGVDGGQPVVYATVATPTLPFLRLDDIPYGSTVYVAATAAPDADWADLVFEPEEWTPGYRRALLEGTRAAIADQPVLSWVKRRRDLPVATIQDPSGLPQTCHVIQAVRPRYAQDAGRFIVALRTVQPDGSIVRTALPVSAIPDGQPVWIFTRYGSADSLDLPLGTPAVPVTWDQQTRQDLLADMSARTEPRVGGVTTSWERIPPRRTWWEASALTGAGLVLALGGIPWGIAWLAVVGAVMAVYGLSWFLQMDPDPYKRRRNVDRLRIGVAATATAISAPAASRSGAGAARTALYAGGAALAADSALDNERERESRVR
jgi:hypothetical protein